MLHSQLSGPASEAERIHVANAQLAKEVMTEVWNTLRTQRRILEHYTDPKRDINAECGYQDTPSLTDWEYLEAYKRNPIAKRVNDVWPSECWKSTPRVYEDEDASTKTAFEAAWDEVCRGLSDCDYFEDDESNPIFEYLERADKLSGIGRYGCILLGVDDGLELSEPLEINPGPTVKRKLIYLKVLDSTVCEVAQLEGDRHNKRYGLPITYNVTLEMLDLANMTGVYVPSGQATTFDAEVHWTRIVHIVDNKTTNDVFGEPRMQVVWDRLYDSTKLYGGSAEMFWKGAFPGISFETHPQMGGEVRVDAKALQEQLENYMHGLQRYLALAGMTANSLSPQVADPSKHIDKLLEAICIALEIPKRVFMGSEQGELASSQDSDTWNDRVKHRQIKYCTPRIIVPMVNRLIQIGVLPVPESGKFRTDWSDLSALTDAEKADIAAKETEALTKYVAGDVESIMEYEDYLVTVMRWSRDVAKEVVSNRIKSLQYIQEIDEEFGISDEENLAGFLPNGQQPGQTPQPQSEEAQ